MVDEDLKPNGPNGNMHWLFLSIRPVTITWFINYSIERELVAKYILTGQSVQASFNQKYKKFGGNISFTYALT